MVRWNPEKLFLAAFLFLLIYDGALRKWVFPQSEQLLFVAKDFVLFIGIVYCVVTKRFPQNIVIHPLLIAPAASYVVWVLISMLNPWLPNFLVAIWGAKSYLLYAVALALLFPTANDSATTLLRRLVRVFPWLVVPVCLIAIAQVFAPSDSVLNRQVREDAEALAFFGDTNLVRVSGTFSYLSGMAGFTQAGVFMGLALFLCGARSLYFLSAFLLTLATVPLTGSRAVVLTLLVGSTLMVTLAFVAKLLPLRRLVFLVVIGLLGTLANIYLTDDAWIALQQRAAQSMDDSNRYMTAFTNAFVHFSHSGLGGFGTGAANLGAPVLVPNVTPFSWIPGNVEFEEESGRIVLELGILGWVISMIFRLGLVVWSIALALRGRTLAIRAIGCMAFPVLLFAAYVGLGVFAAPVWSAYVWLCIVLLCIAQFEQRQLHEPPGASHAANFGRV